jgi:Meiotically up-regulated gene 113
VYWHIEDLDAAIDGSILPRQTVGATTLVKGKLEFRYLWGAKGGRYWYYRRDGHRIPITSPDGRRLQKGDHDFLEAYERIHADFPPYLGFAPIALKLPDARQPAIYFLEAPPLRAVKIGFVHSGSALFARIDALQTGCPYKLRPVIVVEGSFDLEQGTHRLLAAERLQGEWFQVSDRVASLIGTLRNGSGLQQALSYIRAG